jgi:hypothetical protein
VDPVAGARGSASLFDWTRIEDTQPTPNRERQRPGPDLFFSSLLTIRRSPTDQYPVTGVRGSVRLNHERRRVRCWKEDGF